MTIPALPAEGSTAWYPWATGIDTAARGAGAGVDPTDVGFDVVLLMGQSNMAGSNTDYDLRKDPEDPRVLSFDYVGTYTDQIVSARDPLQHQFNSDGAGPGLSFGRWYARSIPGNRAVLLVPVAAGGSPLVAPNGGTWNTNTRGSLYDNAITQAQQALTAAGPRARIVAALWVQGESDGTYANSVAAADYQAALDTLIARLRVDLGLPALPFLIGGMVPEYIASSPINQAIAAVHADTPNRVAYTAYAAGPAGMNKGDNLHYTAAAQRIQGRALFEVLDDAKANGSPTPTLTSSVAPAITGTATTGSVLTVSNGTWSATPDSFTRQWKRAGVNIAGATGTTYTLVQADEGQAITCTVTAVKAGYASGTATSNTVTPTNGTTPALTNSSTPAITGTATTGQTLAVSNGTWSATPDSFTYQWKRAGVNISGATSSTYVLQVADEGQAITATVTAVKAGYTSGTATSTSVTPAAAPAGFTDDFNRSDRTLDNGWLQRGSWTPNPLRIESNQVVKTSGGGMTAAIRDCVSANGTYTLTNAAGADYTRFVLRSDSTLTNYIWMQNGAVATQTGATSASIGSSNGVLLGVVTVVLSGPTIEIYDDGVLKSTITSTFNQTETHFGFGMENADGGPVDNFGFTPA